MVLEYSEQFQFTWFHSMHTQINWNVFDGWIVAVIVDFHRDSNEIMKKTLTMTGEWYKFWFTIYFSSRSEWTGRLRHECVGKHRPQQKTRVRYILIDVFYGVKTIQFSTQLKYYYTHECYCKSRVFQSLFHSTKFRSMGCKKKKKYTLHDSGSRIDVLDTHNMCVPIQSRPNTHWPFVCIVICVLRRHRRRYTAHFPDTSVCHTHTYARTPCRAQ